MAPLVPDVITNELNLVVALLIGVAFGFILEQAGFSSSRKLTRLFYGTDFTVLRVFFTAGATAMTGVVLLSAAGLLDVSVIFVNPRYLHSAIVGGLIMGVGFVVGGYCPGTSFCGAAVGRVDAMAFVAGGLGGAIAFGELFPRLQSFYMAGSRGNPTLASVLGVSPGVVAVGVIVIATAAFVGTSAIERSVNPSSPVAAWPILSHRLAAVALLGAGAAAAAVPGYEARLLARAQSPEYLGPAPIARMSSDELAFRLLDGDRSLLVIDTRPAAAFAQAALPGAVNIALPELFGRTWQDVLSRRKTHTIFVADQEAEAEQAAALALLVGYRSVGVLSGGFAEFKQVILAPASSDERHDIDAETQRFRAEARAKLTALIQASRSVAPARRAVTKVAGGCGI